MSCVTAPRVITAGGVVRFVKCTEQKLCFQGIYENGILQSYRIDNDKGVKIQERFEMDDGRFAEVDYYSNADTMGITLKTKDEMLVYNRELYRNGKTKRLIKLKNGRLDSSFFQMDGVTPLINMRKSNDTTYITEFDSTGIMVAQRTQYYAQTISGMRYVDGELVLHWQSRGANRDTLLNKPDKIKNMRSASQIMEVVKNETPKLRSIYNYHLRQSGFDSKIKVKMTIAPSGSIQYIYPVSFTPQSPQQFVIDVLDKIEKWEFGAIDKGNTTVTIPFTFSRD
jgi:hypothetical protein